MTLIPFNENNLWGIRNSDDKIVLPAIYSELSAFIYKAGVLLNNFESNKIRRLRKPVATQTEITGDPKSDIIFLVRKGSEFYLLKWSVNRFTHQSGILNLFKQFDTLESFELSPYNRKNNNAVEETDIVEIGKFYKDIIHIGNGLFKVKLINVYKTLEPINEDGDHAWEYKFDSFVWQIIDFNGNLISEKPFTEVDSFFNNLCKIRRGDKWNFINERGKQVLNQWHYYLEYPVLNDEIFLAGKKSYFISISSEGFPIIFRTTDFYSAEELSYDDPSNESYSFLKKFEKSIFTTKDLETLIQRIYGNNEVSVSFEERKLLDLYNKDGFLQRLRVECLKPLSENLFIAIVDSDFFFDIDETGNKKIFRHCETSKVVRGEGYGFSFQQQRLVDSSGRFVGENYYHEISDFNEEGIAKASKSYFTVISNGEIKYLDTSLNEEYFTGEINFWKDYINYRIVAKLKHGFIDSTGKEISDFTEDEV